jgi:prevent-host-death family protein
MKTISASKFKERCLALLDRVGTEGIVITKHGRPVARLVSLETDFSRFVARLKGRLRIRGNILSTGAKWDAES